MVLLKLCISQIQAHEYDHLHSTMVLLKLASRIWDKIDYSKFTFHYGLIKTQFDLLLYILNSDLHSTMVLLKQTWLKNN